MPSGSSWHFDDARDGPNLDAAQLNTLAKLNTYPSPDGGFLVNVTAGRFTTTGSGFLDFVGQNNFAMTAATVNDKLWLTVPGLVLTKGAAFPVGEHMPLAEVDTDGVTVVAIRDKRPLASSASGGTPAGDVSGPVGVGADSNLTVYSGTGGKTIKDSAGLQNTGAGAINGRVIATDGTKLDTITGGAEVNPAPVSEADARAGVSAVEETFTALRVAQAIDSLAKPKGHLHGARLSLGSVTQVNVGTAAQDSELTDVSFATLVRWNGLVSADPSAGVGAGGLDAGVEAADTWYAVYVIADSNGVNPVAALLSTNMTTPVLPGGYDRKRLVGVVRNDSGSNLIPFTQYGSGRSRWVYYDLAQGSRQALSAGVAVVWAPVSLVNLVPPTSKRVKLELSFQAGSLGAAGDQLEARPTGSTNAVARVRADQAVDFRQDSQVDMPTNSSQSIDYQVTQGGASQNRADVFVVAWEEEL